MDGSDAEVTLDVLITNNNDVNLAKTWTVKCFGKFYHLFAPQNTTWHCIYPIDPKEHAKMVDIMNKVFFQKTVWKVQRKRSFRYKLVWQNAC